MELPEEKLPQDPSQAQIDAALEKESQAIRAKLPPSTSLVCLCVEGRLRSSEELSALVGTWEHSSAKHLAFVIGGSYGLAERLKGESWVKLSMSPMTFPPPPGPGHAAGTALPGLQDPGRAPATTNDRVPGLKTCSPWIRPKIRWKFMPACGTMSTTACPSGFY